MIKKLLFVIGIIWGIVVDGQTQIKTMSYNLMHFPSTTYYNESTGTFTDRTPVLKGIMDTYQPDILMVCELESSQGADQILQMALQTSDNRYNRANFAYNQSSWDNTLQQLVFYNSQKLTLVSQDIVNTTVRDINHYTFQLNNTLIRLDVFVSHLKASTGISNEQKRLEMVQQLTNYFASIPSNSFVIFGGDFNLYTSDEPAYRELLDATNPIVLVDPINSPGYWTSNYEFETIHTQSPLTTNYHFQLASGGRDGATGGMDDRFDFILMSQNLINGPQLKYVPGSYKAYGNNGNCYNSYISNTNCSGIYPQNLRNLLVNMSDHLPVVMTLETPVTLDINQLTHKSQITFATANISSNEIILNVPSHFFGYYGEIFNQLGQKMGVYNLNQESLNIDISSYAQGIYYIKVKNEDTQKPLKFIKK